MESERHDVTLNDLLQMVKRLIQNQDSLKEDLLDRIDQTEHQLDRKIDRLQNTVIGNGDEQAIIIRLRDNEKKAANLCKKVDQIAAIVDALETTQEAWRNRAIGIAVLLSALGGLVALFGSKILETLVKVP